MADFLDVSIIAGLTEALSRERDAKEAKATKPEALDVAARAVQLAADAHALSRGEAVDAFVAWLDGVEDTRAASRPARLWQHLGGLDGDDSAQGMKATVRACLVAHEAHRLAALRFCEVSARRGAQ